METLGVIGAEGTARLSINFTRRSSVTGDMKQERESLLEQVKVLLLKSIKTTHLSIFVVGKEKVGKSSVLGAIFGRDIFSSSEKVQNGVHKIKIPGTNINVYEVLTPNQGEENFIQSFVETNSSNEVDRFTAIWYVADITSDPNSVVQDEFNGFGNIPLVVILNKIDKLAEDEEKKTQFKNRISELQIGNLLGTFECAAFSSDHKNNEETCQICGTETAEKVFCEKCHTTVNKDALLLTQVLAVTSNAAPPLIAETLCAGQHISMSEKFECSRRIIKEFVDELESQIEAFVKMSVRLSALWGTFDSSEASHNVTQGTSESIENKRFARKAVIAGGYSFLIGWLHETLNTIDINEQEQNKNNPNISSFLGGEVVVEKVQWRYVAEGISLCKSLATTYISSRQAIEIRESAHISHLASTRVSMRPKSNFLSSLQMAEIQKSFVVAPLGGVNFDDVFEKCLVGPSQIQPDVKQTESSVPKPEKETPTKSKKSRSRFFSLFSKAKQPTIHYFGVKLENVPKLPNKLPKVFAAFLDYLWDETVASTEGLFRISGNANEMNLLRLDIERDGEELLNVYSDNCHNVTGLLKEYIRELPDPLIPYKDYDYCLQLQKETLEGSHPAEESVKKLIENLPPINQIIFVQLIQYLNYVSLHESLNKMTANNLAVCFGPDLLKAEEEDLYSVLKDMPVIIDFLKNLIKFFHLYFEDYSSLYRPDGK